MTNENQATGFKVHCCSFISSRVCFTLINVFIQGKIESVCRAFTSPLVILGNSRNGIEDKRAERDGSYVSIQDKVGVQEAT